MKDGWIQNERASRGRAQAERLSAPTKAWCSLLSRPHGRGPVLVAATLLASP